MIPSLETIMTEKLESSNKPLDDGDEEYGYLSVSAYLMDCNVIAIGAYFVGSDKKIQKRCFCTRIDEENMKDYIESNSIKDDSILRRIDKEARDTEMNTEEGMIKAFCKFLDELEALDNNILIITDGYGDIARIDDLMDRYCSRGGIRHHRDGGCRDQADITERLSQTSTFSCFTGESNVEIDRKLNFKATEYLLSLEEEDLEFGSWPPDQAHYIYIQYLASNMMKEAIMKNVDAISSSLDSMMIKKPVVRSREKKEKDKTEKIQKSSEGEKEEVGGRVEREKEKDTSAPISRLVSLLVVE